MLFSIRDVGLGFGLDLVSGWLMVMHTYLYHFESLHSGTSIIQGQIIHEAGEAEAQGPGRGWGPGPPGTTNIFHNFGSRIF